MTDQEPTQTSKIILDTYTDYSEAIAALEEQLQVASVLSENIASVAEAIQEYEKRNNINTPETT